MNVVALVLVATMLWLRRWRHAHAAEERESMEGGSTGVQDVLTWIFVAVLVGGGIAFALTGG